VVSPTLLIVGSDDEQVLRLNELANSYLRGDHELTIVEGASHLFEEPGCLERVAHLAGDWFERWFSAASL
jgi:putative phosphoribosyl transferase